MLCLVESLSKWGNAMYLTFLFQAIEMMFVESLIKADDYLQISSKIQDPAEFWKVCGLKTLIELAVDALILVFTGLMLSI